MLLYGLRVCVVDEAEMETYFVLNDQGEPQQVSDSATWLRWSERRWPGIARTSVTADVVVLTIFHGMAELIEGKPPLVFASYVLGGILAGECVRYPTRSEALSGHDRLVAWCRIGATTSAPTGE